MKKTFCLILMVLCALSLICCSQQAYKEIAFNVQCGASASETVTLSADADADAYVFTGGAYVSVTANPYLGEYGTLQVVRNNSEWTVSYSTLYLEGQETIPVVIGVSSGATLSKQNGAINVKCSVTAQPTEDELKVTTNCETFVIGSPAADSPYQQAVNKRLKNKVGAYKTKTTKAIVIYSDAFGTLTEEQKANIVDCFKKGGDVAFVSHSINVFSSEFVSEVLSKLREKTYEVEVQKYNTEGLTYDDWLNYRGRHLWYVAELPDETSDKSGLAAIGFHFGNKYTYHSNGNMGDLTDYQAGIMADGLAEWMNTTTAEKTKGTGTLQELSEAEIHTLEYYATVPTNGGLYEYPNVRQEIITAYSMHSEGDNRDWYEIDQQITFRNAKVDPVPDINNHNSWWDGYVKNSSGYYDAAGFIYYLDCWENKISLTIPDGNIVLYESHPDTENGSQSSNYSTSNGKSTGVTDGGSVGVSVGFCGIEPTGSFSASYSHSVTETTSTEVTTGTSMTINDLSVTKTTDGSSAKWTYQFSKPYKYSSSSWWAPMLSITDCCQKNSMLYYVDCPSGPVTLQLECPNTYSSFYIDWENGRTDYNGSLVKSRTYFTLREPKRYVEEWSLSCVEYGDIKDDADAIERFESAITRDIIGADNRINKVAGADKDDTTDANILLNKFMDEFESFSESYAARGFTGTYSFKLKSVADKNKYIKKSFTIEKP